MIKFAFWRLSMFTVSCISERMEYDLATFQEKTGNLGKEKRKGQTSQPSLNPRFN